jgi:hypothetical protein
MSSALDLGRSLEVRYDDLALPDKRYLNWGDGTEPDVFF